MSKEGRLRPADLPAGAKRDEAKAIVKDLLQEEMEDPEVGGTMEAIDPAKLNRKDNEIQRHLSRDPATAGEIECSGLDHDNFFYAWMPEESQFTTNGARAAIRRSISVAQRWGFRYVDHDDPEGREFLGKDSAAGSNRRGCGDTLLMRISLENKKAMDQHFRLLQERQGMVEERWALIGMQHGVPAWGGRVDQNPELARRFGGAAAQPYTVTSTFDANAVRREGGIPGLKPGENFPGMR